MAGSSDGEGRTNVEPTRCTLSWWAIALRFVPLLAYLLTLIVVGESKPEILGLPTGNLGAP